MTWPGQQLDQFMRQLALHLALRRQANRDRRQMKTDELLRDGPVGGCRTALDAEVRPMRVLRSRWWANAIASGALRLTPGRNARAMREIQTVRRDNAGSETTMTRARPPGRATTRRNEPTLQPRIAA